MKKSSIITLKTIIALLICIGIANFMLVNVLENLPINIWVARSIGACICVLIGLVLYQLWLKKKSTSD